MNLTVSRIARMMDLAAVQAQHTEQDIRSLAQAAKKYRCAAALALPSLTPLLVELLAGEKDIAVGGVVGFPSGAHTTAIKVAEACELRKMGCRELDMVINVGLLRWGKLARVQKDIEAVREVAQGVLLKVILECHYLSADQIRAACEACVAAKADFVKTSTGWAPTGATRENVALIKSCVGDACQIKAAGGVRDLKTLLDLHRLGATRFGVGLASGVAILQECAGKSSATASGEGY
jgi:deoxyribose-phosphate aldolase